MPAGGGGGPEGRESPGAGASAEKTFQPARSPSGCSAARLLLTSGLGAMARTAPRSRKHGPCHAFILFINFLPGSIYRLFSADRKRVETALEACNLPSARVREDMSCWHLFSCDTNTAASYQPPPTILAWAFSSGLLVYGRGQNLRL